MLQQRSAWNGEEPCTLDSGGLLKDMLVLQTKALCEIGFESIRLSR
jgi:hypothetical protein